MINIAAIHTHNTEVLHKLPCNIADHIILLVNGFIHNTVIVIIRQRRDLFITYPTMHDRAAGHVVHETDHHQMDQVES